MSEQKGKEKRLRQAWETANMGWVTSPCKTLLIFIHIRYCTIVVLNRGLYSNCIALAIVPSWAELGDRGGRGGSPKRFPL